MAKKRTGPVRHLMKMKRTMMMKDINKDYKEARNNKKKRKKRKKTKKTKNKDSDKKPNNKKCL